MYSRILMPVDLSHVDRLGKALSTTADLCKRYDIPVCYVGVTSTTPGPIAATPDEFAGKLEEFSRGQEVEHGVKATSKAYTSHDLAVDLEKTLMKAIQESGADLVVMASHVPGLPEHFFGSHAGHVAAHAKVSVLVVR